MPLNLPESGRRDAAYLAYQKAKRKLDEALQAEAAAWAIEQDKATRRDQKEVKKP